MRKFSIQDSDIVFEDGEPCSLEELETLANKLPWVTPDAIIMPSHQYVVEMKLESERDCQTFALVEYACAKHPVGWKAYFRAYRSRNRYLVLGKHRYWYSQIGPARMLNRCDKSSEVENTRREEGAAGVKNWHGVPYAWKSEYGLECENVFRYCNLVVVSLENGPPVAVRYAAMVPLVDFNRVVKTPESASGPDESPIGEAEAVIKQFLHGVEPAPRTGTNWKRAPTSRGQIALSVPWLVHKNMNVGRVAAHLRSLSGSPQLDVMRVTPLPGAREYMVQLRVPAVST
jgi:hypothetical protein